MSLLDDDNEIEYSCAIVNARKYVEELYAEADRKRAEIVDHLWELQAKKIGVPQGTTATEAWGWFRDAITIETQDKAVEMFDVPISYEKSTAKQQYFEKRCNEALRDRDQCFMDLQKSRKLSWNFAEEILKLVVMCPTLEYSKEVVADALDLIYGSTWKYYVASTFEIAQVPYIIGKCNRDAHKTIGELQKMYRED